MTALPATVPRTLRVVLIGAESTGKTTLAADLATQFSASWVPEYARQYLERKSAPLGPEDVEPIARGQIAAEHEGERRGGPVLVLDTDLVSTTVYARHYYGSCPEWIEAAACERRGDLYLLHHPDVAWVADGAQRDQPNARQEIHARFREALSAIGAFSVDVRGPWNERRRIALDATAALLARNGTASPMTG